MLQVALLCLLLGSGHSFSVSRNTLEKTEESSGLNWSGSDKVFDDGPKGNKADEDDLSISALLEKANKNLGKNPSDPEVRELDIVVGSGLQNADPCTADNCTWLRDGDGKINVPYRISNEYSPDKRFIIEDGLRSFAAWTCIRFVPQTTEKDYIDIVSKTGCWSSVGRRGGRQELSLNKEGCVVKLIVQHELLHALGFHHEQSRSDRDLHVRILWQNIKPDDMYNFYRVQSNNLFTPYDYDSVMQYGSTASSKNGEPTMVPIPDPTVPIGMAKEMNYYDILRVNRLYSC